MSTYLKVGDSKGQKVADLFQKIPSWKSGPNGIIPRQTRTSCAPDPGALEDRNHSDARSCATIPVFLSNILLIPSIREGSAPAKAEQQPVFWPDSYISVLQPQITNELFNGFINTLTLCMRPRLESWIQKATNASQTRQRSDFTFSRQISYGKCKVFSAEHRL